MNTLAQDIPAADRLAPARDAFRTLMVHVQASEPGRARLESAAHLARRLDATLYGVGAEAIDPVLFSSSYGFGGELLADIEAAVGENLDHAEAMFRQAAGGLKSDWSAAQDEPIIAVTRAARSADLIIASRHGESAEGSYRHCSAGDLILKSGRPVLLVPQAGGALQADCVVVAWKDTREARRAVADAMPLLRAAAEVLVMEVCHPDAALDAQVSATAVAQHLKRHGVNAHGKARAALAVDAAFELATAAQGLGADLIVAGGYGHTRVGEWVFGGVTQDLLRQPGGFIFLSH